MKLKGVRFEDFLQYKKPCMFLIMPYCTFKCDKDSGSQVCQNWGLATSNAFEIDEEALIRTYLDQRLTTSVVFGGLEPFDSFSDVISFVNLFRNKYKCRDDIVIFTGYNKEEINEYIKDLQGYENIIVKFGRFIPNRTEHFDEVLGVMLGSDNQYAERIS